jgi:hypothetical protein
MARMSIAMDRTREEYREEFLTLINLVAQEFYQQRVVATDKHTRPGTFFGIVQALAKKPTTLASIIAGTLQKYTFTSKKSHAFVAGVRVRHALTRLGYLQLAK